MSPLSDFCLSPPLTPEPAASTPVAAAVTASARSQARPGWHHPPALPRPTNPSTNSHTTATTQPSLLRNTPQIRKTTATSAHRGPLPSKPESKCSLRPTPTASVLATTLRHLARLQPRYERDEVPLLALAANVALGKTRKRVSRGLRIDFFYFRCNGLASGRRYFRATTGFPFMKELHENCISIIWPPRCIRVWMMHFFQPGCAAMRSNALVHSLVLFLF